MTKDCAVLGITVDVDGAIAAVTALAEVLERAAAAAERLKAAVGADALGTASDKVIREVHTALRRDSLRRG